MTKAEEDLLTMRLEAGFSDTSDVFVPKGIEPQEYLDSLIADIQAHRCAPHQLSATVMEPGFPDLEPGQTVTGICVANRAGYWLVSEPNKDRFYAFWGESPDSLGAHGVYGSPLYCWSA